jgi:Ca2+-binding EF-hand superfamily protein
VLSFNELLDGLEIGSNKKEMKRIINQVDTDHSGKISYTEFLAATLKRDIFADDAYITDAFKMFDRVRLKSNL